MAINRIRLWYDTNREKCSYDEGELLKKILSNVVGFDLNPLAVMASRTNYLIAIKALIRHSGHVEIPVYLCDSIITPAEYGDLFTGGAGNIAKVPCSAMKPPHLLVPKEIAKSPGEVARYVEVLETCVRNSYAPDEFISRCREEGLVLTAADIHIDLYKELVRLDKENKNGIWARIIKNNFAPLFVGKVDFIAGNPPWVRWGFLPSEYREQTAHLWREYDLFTKKGLESRMGTAELDLSMLFTYVAADIFLKNANGRLGFVITKEVLKSKGAGEGFRKFHVSEKSLVLNPFRVDDLSALQPFYAANKTACLFLEKGTPQHFPVPYFVWSKSPDASVAERDMSLIEAGAYLSQTAQEAKPVGEVGSAWQSSPAATSGTLKKLAGQSKFKARIGARVEPYGVYWVQVVDGTNPRKPIIENLPELGKTAIRKISPRVIEPDYLFPVLRGRDIKRWKSSYSVWALILNRSTKRDDLIEELTLRAKAPLTFEYLNEFRQELLNRANFWKFFGKRQISGTEIDEASSNAHIRLRSSRPGFYEYEVSDAPFYAMFNIGPYTFAPFRVCWSRMSNAIKAAVVSEVDTPIGRKTLIPTDTATIVPFESEDEAHYFCSIVNSSPFRWFVTSFSSAGRGFGSAAILKHILIPDFDRKDPTHKLLSSSSLRCHDAAKKGDTRLLEELEPEVDSLSVGLWRMTNKELKAIQAEMGD